MGEKVKIDKQKLPKARRTWKLNPTTRVKNGDKKYSRARVKRASKRVMKNGL